MLHNLKSDENKWKAYGLRLNLLESNLGDWNITKLIYFSE